MVWGSCSRPSTRWYSPPWSSLSSPPRIWGSTRSTSGRARVCWQESWCPVRSCWRTPVTTGRSSRGWACCGEYIPAGSLRRTTQTTCANFNIKCYFSACMFRVGNGALCIALSTNLISVQKWSIIYLFIIWIIYLSTESYKLLFIYPQSEYLSLEYRSLQCWNHVIFCGKVTCSQPDLCVCSWLHSRKSQTFKWLSLWGDQCSSSWTANTAILFTFPCTTILYLLKRQATSNFYLCLRPNIFNLELWIRRHLSNADKLLFVKVKVI